MDDGDQLFGGLDPGVVPGSRRIDHVLADMVFDHFGDEAVHRPAAGGGLLQHAGAFAVLIDGASG